MDHAFGDGDGRPVVEMPRRDGKLHDGKKGGNLHPTSEELVGQIPMRSAEGRRWVGRRRGRRGRERGDVADGIAFVDVARDDEWVAEEGGRQRRGNCLLDVLPAQTEGRQLEVDTNVLGRGRRVHLLEWRGKDEWVGRCISKKNQLECEGRTDRPKDCRGLL